MKIFLVGTELFHADGRTDIKTVTVTSFHSVNTPKQKYTICQNVSASTKDMNYILCPSFPVRK